MDLVQNLVGQCKKYNYFIILKKELKLMNLKILNIIKAKALEH